MVNKAIPSSKLPCSVGTVILTIRQLIMKIRETIGKITHSKMNIKLDDPPFFGVRF